MQYIIGFFIILVVIGLAIELIKLLFIPLVFIGAFYVIFKIVQKAKNKKALKLQQQIAANEERALKDSIDYKMTTLLTIAKYDVASNAQRTAYKTKDTLTLLDLWYKYMDLRAKLHLNNTSISREESVLHLMCDEILVRLQQAEIEITQAVRAEFIEENLSPLLHDILDIMEGIRPLHSVSINAYQLLNKEKGERETVLETISR